LNGVSATPNPCMSELISSNDPPETARYAR
jgi:hypothetical protein